MSAFFQDLLNKPGDLIAAFAALLALVSLFVSISSARSTKKYAREQVELAQKQFLAANTPDVGFRIYCQRKHPDSHDFSRGLFLEATNHSTSVTVNQVSVIFTGEELDDFKGLGTFFPTFTDLKPGQTLKLESLHDFEQMVANSFPANTVAYADVAPKNSPLFASDTYEKYPTELAIEYLPRFSGATLLKRKEPMYLVVKRKQP